MTAQDAKTWPSFIVTPVDPETGLYYGVQPFIQRAALFTSIGLIISSISTFVSLPFYRHSFTRSVTCLMTSLLVIVLCRLYMMKMTPRYAMRNKGVIVAEYSYTVYIASILLCIAIGSSSCYIILIILDFRPKILEPIAVLGSTLTIGLLITYLIRQRTRWMVKFGTSVNFILINILVFSIATLYSGIQAQCDYECISIYFSGITLTALAATAMSHECIYRYTHQNEPDHIFIAHNYWLTPFFLLSRALPSHTFCNVFTTRCIEKREFCEQV